MTLRTVRFGSESDARYSALRWASRAPPVGLADHESDGGQVVGHRRRGLLVDGLARERSRRRTASPYELGAMSTGHGSSAQTK